ncbi:hypothetical protein SAMN05428944_3500 [Streptomyces sp. 1222.5]|uniref:hypothetical protein n=1 Tax=unclassified Streptomyces TaxID=2593676 RepID=UPI00089971F2|nr:MULTISPECIES: hypothetical protein [unclassified Streptomyces]PKW09345.1 hypothetical protein BX260_4593 [Streptomyces sp. 5112.2]SEC37870.1 hypothetical protein SAMN05428944_3500 [Streptomyces sp. 1222.5]
MPKSTRAGALLALAVTGLALGATLATPANAAAAKAPGFLKAADLPPHPSSTWTAGKVTAGVPEAVEQDRCLSMALGGGSNTWYREFRTDLDTSARQVSVRSSTTAAAKGRFSRLNKDIKSCAARIEKADPETEATLRDYGTLPVEEGAHVYGLHTVTTWGASDIRLLSIGRDGRTVTVVDWGQLGGFRGAPVKAFKKTTVTAVNKLD